MLRRNKNMCVNYYSYLTTNQADSQPGWAKKDRFDVSAK